MLQSLTSLYDYVMRATDGDIGHLYEFLFEDDRWGIKYLVVDTGGWIFGRKVLLSPAAIGRLDWPSHHITVNLEREQVRNSPDIDTDRPVSSQQLELLHQYYEWPGTIGGTGIAFEPLFLPPLSEQEKEEITRLQDSGNPHLRSTRNVVGYRLEARDGEIGHVGDFLLNEEWHIPYVVIDIKMQGRKVLF